jgi:hypothetical protein
MSARPAEGGGTNLWWSRRWKRQLFFLGAVVETEQDGIYTLVGYADPVRFTWEYLSDGIDLR